MGIENRNITGFRRIIAQMIGCASHEIPCARRESSNRLGGEKVSDHRKLGREHNDDRSIPDPVRCKDSGIPNS